MGNSCCSPSAAANAQPGSAVQISTNQTVYPKQSISLPENAGSYTVDVGGYTLEVAYQRAQGRRAHQEDYVSLCSLRSHSKQQMRHDTMFGEPGKFENSPKLDAEDVEDEFDTHWFAVFDGHGGSQVSRHCAENMQNLFNSTFATLTKTEKTSQEKIETILRDSFMTFDEDIKLLPPQLETIVTPSCFGKGQTMTLARKSSAQGSTATVLTVTKLFDQDAIVTVGNSGDSRLIAFTVENIPTHAPDEEIEDGTGRRSSFYTVTTRVKKFLSSEPTSSVFGSYFSQEGMGSLTMTSKTSAMLRKILRSKYKQDITTKAQVKAERFYETIDHQPSVPAETERILALGGQVINQRVNGVLAVSRALGDHDQKQAKGLSAEPDVFSLKLSSVLKLTGDPSKDNKEVIVCMASDGLWMYLTSDKVQQDIVEILSRGYSLKEAVQVLMDKIIVDFRGVDNTSIMMIRITPTDMLQEREEMSSREFHERLARGKKKNKNMGTMRSYGSVQPVSVVEMEVGNKTEEVEVDTDTEDLKQRI